MKKLIQQTGVMLLVFLAFSFSSREQKGDGPVSFKYEVKKMPGGVYEVKILARIDEPWHIYSQSAEKDGPSLPTHIKFTKNPLVELIGKPEEKGQLVIKHEETLGVNLKYYTEQVEFVQKIKLKANVITNIAGSIEYMACTDEQCLLPTTEKFTVGIK